MLDAYANDPHFSVLSSIRTWIRDLSEDFSNPNVEENAIDAIRETCAEFSKKYFTNLKRSQRLIIGLEKIIFFSFLTPNLKFDRKNEPFSRPGFNNGLQNPITQLGLCTGLNRVKNS